MSRALSAEAVRELLAQHSGEAFLELLTLSHPSMATVRMANNLQPVISRGESYIAFPFKIDLPSDLAEQLPNVQLHIGNHDRRLIDELRAMEGAMVAQLEIVAASNPDEVEVGPFEFEIGSVTYNAEAISAALGSEPILNEPYPAESFTPQFFPQLFSR